MTKIYGLKPWQWAVVILVSAWTAVGGSYGGLAGTFGAWMMYLVVTYGVALLFTKISRGIRSGTDGAEA